jgi:hypothetical protein
MDIVRSVDSQTLKLSTVAGSGAKGYKGRRAPSGPGKTKGPVRLGDLPGWKFVLFGIRQQPHSSRGREK